MSEALLSIRNLTKHFPKRDGLFGKTRSVRALDGVDLDLEEGETVGLVGESGCGKTTLGRVVLRLVDPTAGTIRFESKDITSLSQSALRPIRRRMQIVFQDPVSSLNPRMTVRAMLGEAMQTHGLVKTDKEEKERIGALLDRVGLRPEHMSRYPHEFSGGQRQRIGIARALAVEPRFIVCDEPVSALDVSIQAQIVNLLADLQEQLKLSYLFIAHDLEVVRFISRRVAVMYLGKIVELMPSTALDTPKHPYTQALRSAVPVADPGYREEAKRKRIILEGDVPSPIDPPSGCHFHPRCPIAKKGLCDVKAPELRELSSNHKVACHLAE